MAEGRRGNWGRWGDDDERGALNLLGPEMLLRATQACRTGKLYSLGLPIARAAGPVYDYRGAPQRLTLTSRADAAMFAAYGAKDGTGSNEDVLVLASHTLTHMDALSHVFAEGGIYNGHADEFASTSGAARCGIEKTAAFAGHAVLLDVAAHQGVDWLEPGHVIDAAQLEACRAAQGVELAAGDILLVRTGWLDFYRSLPEGSSPPMEQSGLGLDAVSFVRDHDVAAVGADNPAIECMPFDQGEFLGVHRALLVDLGVTLIENLDLRAMADDRCYESLFCVAGLPVTGATGSPVNPIAIG
ncbi:MAG: putative cyclase [Acidimicrobiales bacterium]|nr:putative cyclase [Acidimicrobiales bacterium]